MVFSITLIAVLALQIGGYALWQHVKRTCAAQQAYEDRINTRIRGGAGRFVGGVDRPGDN